MTGISYNEYEEIVRNIDIDFKTSASEQIRNILEGEPTEAGKLYEKGKTVKLPKYSILITKQTKSKLLERFLSRRQISLDVCIKYKCHICELGEFSHRMIIPVYFFMDKLVGYQGVDLTGQSKLKYRTSSTSINDYLYNYTNAVYGDKINLVEGILDEWRLEGDTVCSFGTSLTDVQKRLIIEIKPKELSFCWDSEAYWIARSQAKFFQPFIEKIRIVKFPEGEDPDSYGRDYGKDALSELIEETDWM